MTVYYRVYADPSDTDVRATNATYATARNSTMAVAAPTGSFLEVSSTLSGGFYNCGQVFMQFDTSAIPAGWATCGLSFSYQGGSASNLDNIEVRAVPVMTNKIAGGSIGSYTLQVAPFPSYLGLFGSRTVQPFTVSIPATATYRIGLFSEMERLGTVPTLSTGILGIYSAQSVGTGTTSPAIEYTYPGRTVVITTPVTRATPFTLPANWADPASIELISSGGNGHAGTAGVSGNGGGGGGGGGYVRSQLTGRTPGRVVYYQIGAAGSAVDTWVDDRNLLLRTDASIGNAAWVKTNVTATDFQPGDPLGGINKAALITETAATGQHSIHQVITKTASIAQSYRFSTYVKSTTRNVGIGVRLVTAAVSAGVGFDLQGTDGGVGTTMTPWTDDATRVTVTGAAMAIAPGGTGTWYRISATINFTTVSTDTQFQWQALSHLPGSGTLVSYLGSTSANFSIFGMTLVYGVEDRGYAPTTTLAVYTAYAKFGTSATNVNGAAAGNVLQGDVVGNGSPGGTSGATRGGAGGGGAGSPLDYSGSGGNSSTTLVSGGGGGGGSAQGGSTFGGHSAAAEGGAGGGGYGGVGGGGAGGSLGVDAVAATPGTGAGGGGGYHSTTAAANTAGKEGAINPVILNNYLYQIGPGGGGGGGGGNDFNGAGAITSGGRAGGYGGGGGGGGYRRLGTGGAQVGGAGGPAIIVFQHVGTYLGPEGGVNQTLNALTVAGTGTARFPSGPVTATFSPMTASATGKVRVQGVLGGGGPATAPASRLLTSFAPGFDRNDFTGEVGIRFLLTANKTFSWLGVYCCTGNTGLHRVHLYDFAAPSSPLRTADIDLTGKVPGEVVWASITPIDLTAGNYYAVMKETTASGQFWFEEGPTTLDPTLSSEWTSIYRSPGGSITPYTADYHYVGVDLGYPEAEGPYRLGPLTLAGSGAVLPVITGALGGGVPVVWSATYKSPDITLSGSNMVATHNGGNLYHAMGRADTAISTGGKKYCEFLLNAIGGGGVAIGLVAPAAAFPSGDFLGGWGNTLGFFANGQVWNNFTNFVTYGWTAVDGDRMCMAVDFNNSKIWVRLNNGNWNDSGTADPATNTGGVNFVSLWGAGDVYPAYNVHPTAGQVTANFGATAFTHTPPSGFTGLAVAGAVALNALTLSASGTVIASATTGTLNTTLGTLTGTLTGKVTVRGTAAGTLLPLSLVGTGTVANTIYSGTLSATLAPLTLSAFGSVSQTVRSATLSATLGALTGTLSGKVTVGGSAAGTLLPLSLVGTGSISQTVRSGTLSATLEALTLFASSTVYAKVRLTEDGRTRITEAGVTRITEGQLITFGSLDVTLGALTGTLSGKVTVAGTAAGTLLPLMLVSTGSVSYPTSYGSLSATLGPASLVATGTVREAIHGTLSATLAPITLLAIGTLPVRGTLGVTLGALTGTLTGKVTVKGTAAGTLLPMMLVGTVHVFDPTAGFVNVWTGTQWARKPAKVWDGSTWVKKYVKYWNGSDWVV